MEDTYVKNILFKENDKPITPHEINEEIASFGYNDAVDSIIKDSKELNEGIFIRCTARILSNFKMTRRGPFKGISIDENGEVSNIEILTNCWNTIGDRLIEIRESIIKSGFSRDRYLLELSEPERKELIAKIWLITKQLLPFTMGKTTYGLVGASKILFAVFPEIVLPVDNKQWLQVFKTVDMGDIINHMVADIQHWENVTEEKLNETDLSKKLTTLPSVYNVMAMATRPNND